MDELVSVVIPVYNAEKFVERCLKSVLSQTYENFEAICVDDGSTDSSGLILDKYQKQDSRIKVFHIENQGVSKARNFGLERIAGKWFSFLDIDDWIEADFLEVLLSNALKNECSVSACGFVRDYGTDKAAIGKTDNKVMLLSSSQECITSFICGGFSLQGMVWNKLYRSENYSAIRFDEKVRINEDCLYTYDVLSICDKACLSIKSMYHWCFHNDSACHGMRKKADFVEADVFVQLLEKIAPKKGSAVDLSLKKNYVCSVLRIMWDKKDENAVGEAEARARVALWKKDVFPIFSFRQKLKYYIVLKVPCLKYMVNRFR